MLRLTDIVLLLGESWPCVFDAGLAFGFDGLLKGFPKLIVTVSLVLAAGGACL